MRALVLVGLLVAPACREAAVRQSDAAAFEPNDLFEPAADLTRARGLYAQHCAVCHGERGGGDGEGAHLLYPPARDFTLGFFRLASTENAVPTEEDLVRTLRRGMPGSAMPPFAWLAERDLVDLARLVRQFARDGLLDDLQAQAFEEEATLDEEEANAIVARWLEPGLPIEPLPPAEPTAPVLGHGRRLFLRHCAVCHGLDGRGRGGAPKRHEDGSLTWARDFTAGILKGGSSRYDLTCRIRAGMGGSAMPPTQLPRSDTAALVAYVQALIPAGAPERHLQVRTRVVAERVDAAPVEADWRDTEERLLHLAPLAWNDHALHDVRVSALHDGEQLWIRLRWEDETRDDRVLGGTPFPDAAAVQISTAVAPPLFGMGAEGTPVNLWHWSAARWSDLAGLHDPFEFAGHGVRSLPEGRETTDAPLYQPPPDSESAVALEAEGFRRIGAGGSKLDAESEWRDGTWELTLARRLRQTSAREVDLVLGQTVQFGVALWNGAAEDRRGQKSVTIWHELQIRR